MDPDAEDRGNALGSATDTMQASAAMPRPRKGRPARHPAAGNGTPDTCEGWPP
jgi:hypothetical protein